LATAKKERVGVILVHGIGEQGRFEHLESHTRPLIQAIASQLSPSPPNRLSVEILEGAEAALSSQHQNWASGPSVRATVKAGAAGSEDTLEIDFHEVWWADVNEPYSLGKQIRFWGWGLSVWAYPNVEKTLPGTHVMHFPTFRNRTRLRRALDRVTLFFIANVFLMAAFSLGALVFLLKRLLDFSAPSPVRVFVNYISGVKLYVQSRRSGGDFLDTIDDWPRVSIRRRMIRVLADVSTGDYDRWYVLAHSLGSVVAFNGLMENCHAFPNYLDQRRWEKLLSRGIGGLVANAGATEKMHPARPVWLEPGHVVFRDKLFENFSGLLTYGCPLDKFAGIWSDRVPINVREPAFAKDAEWINVYDPTDPVSAALDAFRVPSGATTGAGSRKTLEPQNHAYRAHWLLLLSHIRYMTLRSPRKGPSLADATALWLLDGGPFPTPRSSNARLWMEKGSFGESFRRQWARAMWLIAYAMLTAIAAVEVYYTGLYEWALNRLN
jgi:hypothetical protein